MVNTSTPTPSGFRPDWGRLFGARGNGLIYGWNKNATGLTYDRNLQSDQRFDTGIAPGGRRWEIMVPNGTYSVHLMGGDLAYRKKQMFTMPVGEWFRGESYPWLAKTLRDSQLLQQLFQPEQIESMLARHHARTGNFTRELRALVALALWAQQALH